MATTTALPGALLSLEEKPKITIEAVMACRYNFRHYLYWCHDIIPRPHQEPMVEALQALGDARLRNPKTTEDHDGNITCPDCTQFIGCSEEHITNKLLIEAFPGSGKTTLTVRWSIWRIGQLIVNEGRIPQFGMVSYAEDVAELRSVAVRDSFGEDGGEIQRKLVFPEKNEDPTRDVRPWTKKGWNQGEWFLRRPDATHIFPTMRAAGMMGSVLSYRFPSGLVVDDPTDPTELGAVRLENDWTTWRRVLKTRIIQGVTPVVMDSTRWKIDDLPGRIKEIERDWHVVWVPAFNEETQETVWPPETSNLDGEPMGISTEALLLEKEQDALGFETQWMARPPSTVGEIFTGFQESYKPKIADVLRVIQFWDTATTEKTRSSYTAMVEFWRLRNGKTFINKVVNLKTRIAEVVEIMQQSYYSCVEEVGDAIPVTVFIENKHAGPVYAEFLRNNAPIPIRLHNIPQKTLSGRATRKVALGDRVQHSASVVAHINAGTVYCPVEWQGWKEAFYNQVMSFPGNFDDMVSALIGGVEVLYPTLRGGRPTGGPDFERSF